MKISTSRINDYTTELKIDGKTFILIDNRIKSNQKNCKLKLISNIFKFASYTCMIIAFMYIIGIPGHMDFIEEANMIDTWSTWDYARKVVSSLSLFGISEILFKIHEYMNKKL